MEESNIWAVIITAIATLLTALGFPKLHEQITKRKEIATDSACKEKIQAMELRMQQIVTGVDMMLTILESEFDKESGYHNVILKVKQILADEQQFSD